MSIIAPLVRRLIRRRIRKRGESSDALDRPPRAGGQGLRPITLYRLGDAYFVEDGNHRVSVARFHGAEWIDADVTELRPVGAAGQRAQATPEPASRAA